ncbi:hypothetical protein ACFX15_036110 [Malus domestica]
MISQFRNFLIQSDDLLLETSPQYMSLASTIAMGDLEAAPLRNASSALSVFGLTHPRLCLNRFLHRMYIITCLSYCSASHQALHTNNGAQAWMAERQLDSASIKINSKRKP